MSLLAATSALDALLERGGRRAICEAFVESLVKAEGLAGASVALPGMESVSLGRAGGRRFSLDRAGGSLTVFGRSPAHDVDGEPLAHCLDQILALQAERDQSLQARTQEVRIVVHDIRSLLAVMLGHCEILGSGLAGELNPRQRQSVASIRRQVERCEVLLSDRRDKLVHAGEVLGE